jgi:hypothetical protein
MSDPHQRIRDRLAGLVPNPVSEAEIADLAARLAGQDEMAEKLRRLPLAETEPWNPAELEERR